MSRHNSQRSADALEAFAACFIAYTLYPSARQLIDYLDEADDDTIRADAQAAADSLASIRERILAFVEKPPTSADTEQVDALQQQLSRVQENIDEQRSTIVEMQHKLEERDARIQQNNEAHSAERDHLIEESQAANARIKELDRALSEAQEENHKLRAKSSSYEAVLRERTSVPTDLIESDEQDEPELTIEGVIEIAREQYDRLQIPDAALKELDALESDEKSADWAREILRGLQSLQAYAEEAEHFTGSFWEWCEHSNHPDTWNASPQKLAMSESDTVKKDGRLWRQRRFLISTEVEPTGYKHMEAHLKIAEGGGQHIPRLYFHDDAKGRTGHIHIGFVGPHRLVPTGQS